MAKQAKQLLVGVDVGGTKTAVVLAVQPSRVLWRREFPTRPEDGPDHAVHTILELVRQGCRELGGEPQCLGVSCGGPLDHERGIIQAPPNLWTWIDLPLKQIVEEALGVPCRIENDANAGAIAEHRYGAGRGCRHLAFLTMGTGIGAGLILNGQLYRGATALAGEIGHVGLTDGGPVGYGKAGSVEGWASGGGMVQHATELVHTALREGEPTLLTEALPDLTARDVGQAMLAGDVVAERIVRHTGERLGQALAILVDILNPQRIIVGGLAMRLGDTLLEPARRVLRDLALQRAAEACVVAPAALGEAIGDIAALCVAQGDLDS